MTTSIITSFSKSSANSLSLQCALDFIKAFYEDENSASAQVTPSADTFTKIAAFPKAQCPLLFSL